MTDYVAVYRAAHERIAALVRAATEEQRARIVPACPEWTVSDTVAHLAANATDAVAGRLTSPPNEEQTAAQVTKRRGRPVEDVLKEWDSAAEPVERIIAATTPRMLVAWVNDILTHEADIRGALQAGRPPDPAWCGALDLSWPFLPKRLGHLRELTIRTEDRCVTVGSGEPRTTLEVQSYEFWRSVLGRRSMAQMAAWNWTGDPEPYLRAIPVFAPPEVDLAE